MFSTTCGVLQQWYKECLNLVGAGLQFSVSDAIEKCRQDWMRGALEQCVSYLGSAGSDPLHHPAAHRT